MRAVSVFLRFVAAGVLSTAPEAEQMPKTAFTKLLMRCDTQALQELEAVIPATRNMPVRYRALGKMMCPSATRNLAVLKSKISLIESILSTTAELNT